LINDFAWVALPIEIVISEENLSLIRVLLAIISTSITVISFYIKLKEKHARSKPRLAISRIDWDAASKLPIIPIPCSFKSTPFPFAPSRLDNRVKAASGWFTATEIRIWNAGNGIIFGPRVKSTSVAFLCIPHSIGEYQIRYSLSNDPEIEFQLASTLRNRSDTEDRIPINFDFMHSGKGILLSIWHNSEDGSAIRVRAFSEGTPDITYGTTLAFKPRFVQFMGWLTDIGLVSSIAISAYAFQTQKTYQAVIAIGIALLTFIGAFSIRKFTLSPADLIVSNINMTGTLAASTSEKHLDSRST